MPIEVFVIGFYLVLIGIGVAAAKLFGRIFRRSSFWHKRTMRLLKREQEYRRRQERISMRQERRGR